jgi:hypothetical protein
LGPGIVHLEFRGLNSAVWMGIVKTGRNSEPNPSCVISALHISKLPRSELARIVKIQQKNSKTLKTLIKLKNVKKIKKSKNRKIKKL